MRIARPLLTLGIVVATALCLLVPVARLIQAEPKTCDADTCMGSALSRSPPSMAAKTFVEEFVKENRVAVFSKSYCPVRAPCPRLGPACLLSGCFWKLSQPACPVLQEGQGGAPVGPAPGQVQGGGGEHPTPLPPALQAVPDSCR